MFRIKEYRITPVMIDQAHGAARKVWFLDAVEVDETGRVSTSNLRAADEQTCIQERARLIRKAYDDGYEASEQAYPLVDNPFEPRSVLWSQWNTGHEQATADLCGPKA